MGLLTRKVMGEEGFFDKVVRRRKLESVFLFVTNDCNSKCRTCFYAKESHPGANLTFAQIRSLSETAPRFDKLWLSGGEPFLRGDLVEIIELFYRNNDIKTINLPTNGLLPERVETEVRRLVDRCPNLNVHLNYSLDGLGATHDRLRGVPGGFEKTVQALERTSAAFSGHPRIHQNVATVVTGENVDQLFDLGLYLFKRFRLATQFFEAVRGDPRDPALSRADRPTLEAFHQQLVPLMDLYANRLFKDLPAGGKQLAKLSFIGVMRELYRIQETNLNGPAHWGMDCTAGETTLVLDHDGGFRSCELRGRIGHARDYGFDLKAMHDSVAMREEIRAIGGGERANCWCTHTCWMLSSMKFSPKKIVFEVPKRFLEARKALEQPLSADAIDLAALEKRYGLAGRA